MYNPDQKNSDGGRRPNGSKIPGEWASNPAQDKMGDACDPDNDNDGLPDSQESDATCPYRLYADSDGDTVLDGFEVATGFDPCNTALKPGWEGGSDLDGDGLQDGLERKRLQHLRASSATRSLAGAPARTLWTATATAARTRWR